MKVVILAGGFGTRLSEETALRPKPMVEIGNKPILWHIMKIYSAHGLNDFIICLGYKGYIIKEYFANYFLHTSNLTINLANNAVEVHDSQAEPWRVTLIDTGQRTMTGGRIKRIAPYLGNDERFCLTYGDGVGDIDITAQMAFAHSEGTQATLTAVQPPGRFGALEMDGTRIRAFQEKPQGEGGYINGGFFVLHRDVIERIEGDATVWEREPLEGLAADGELSAFVHRGYWQPMDTLRDKRMLEERWTSGLAPWKMWA